MIRQHGGPRELFGLVCRNKPAEVALVTSVNQFASVDVKAKSSHVIEGRIRKRPLPRLQDRKANREAGPAKSRE